MSTGHNTLNATHCVVWLILACAVAPHPRIRDFPPQVSPAVDHIDKMASDCLVQSCRSVKTAASVPSLLFSSLYSSLHPQQIALRLIKLLMHRSHLGTGLSWRSMPLSASPSALPIKSLVSLKPCFHLQTMVTGNENEPELVLLKPEGNIKVVACV